MEEEVLEYRLYFFVPYNLSEIQKGIQAGHAALEYVNKYGYGVETHQIWDFISRCKTWIILNGGTTNSALKEEDGKIRQKGSINQIAHELKIIDYEYAGFYEVDLNDALTAICFLADERTWNLEKYPDWYAVNTVMPLLNNPNLADDEVDMGLPVEVNGQNQTYNEWVKMIGGAKNLKIRELIHPSKAKLA